jgi:hypothetical protein
MNTGGPYHQRNFAVEKYGLWTEKYSANLAEAPDTIVSSNASLYDLLKPHSHDMQ